MRECRRALRAARHLASRGQLRATKSSTTHAITRRDVIYRAICRALTHAASSDSGRQHAAAVRVVADCTLPRQHGLLRPVLPLALLLADAYVTQRVNCSPTRFTVACRDVTAQSRTRHSRLNLRS